MTLWHEKADFQALRREWYAKLADSGFRDIEQVVDERGTIGDKLLGMSGGDLCRGLYKAESEEFYTRARQHLHELEEGSIIRRLWEPFSEAVPFSKIPAPVVTVTALFDEPETSTVRPDDFKKVDRKTGLREMKRSSIARVLHAERERMLALVAAEADTAGRARFEAWNNA